jgi:hypothetical protein
MKGGGGGDLGQMESADPGPPRNGLGVKVDGRSVDTVDGGVL